MGAWDLVDKNGAPKDWTLEISKVKQQKVKSQQNPKGRGKPHIYFRGAEKFLIAGATICKAIESMYGPDFEKWEGKRITLYQSATDVGTEHNVPCIRVRVSIPKTAAETIPSQDVDPVMRSKQDAAFGREPGDDSDQEVLK